MTIYVAGTLSGDELTVDFVGDFPRESDFTANVPTAGRTVLALQSGWADAVAAAANGSIVGGVLHRTTGTFTPRDATAIPTDVAGQKAFAAGWYIEAMLVARKDWWPYATLTNPQRTRGQQVVNIELPHWLADQYGLMIGVIDGDVFPTYTSAQRIDLLEHFNAHLRGGRSPAQAADEEPLAGGIVFTWYKVGIALPTGDSNATSWRGDVRGYSDFVTSTGELRTPDYAWNPIPNLAVVMSAPGFTLPTANLA